MKKIIYLLVFIFCINYNVSAQALNIDSLLQTLKCDCDTTEGVDPPLLKVTESASFHGGDSALFEYFSHNIKKMPVSFGETPHIVTVVFRVDSIGKAGDALYTDWSTPEIIFIDSLLKLMVKKMPLWEPSRSLSTKKGVSELQIVNLIIYQSQVIMRYREKIFRSWR
jgi:hypothetical protein